MHIYIRHVDKNSCIGILHFKLLFLINIKVLSRKKLLGNIKSEFLIHIRVQ